MVLIWPSYNKNLLALIKINLWLIKVLIVEEMSTGRKEFRNSRTVIGAKHHENDYSNPSNVCVYPTVTCCRILWLFPWRFWRVTPSLMTSGSSMWPSTRLNPGCFPRGLTERSVFSPRERDKNSHNPPVFKPRNYTAVPTLWGRRHVAGRNHVPDLILNMSL